MFWVRDNEPPNFRPRICSVLLGQVYRTSHRALIDEYGAVVELLIGKTKELKTEICSIPTSVPHEYQFKPLGY